MKHSFIGGAAALASGLLMVWGSQAAAVDTCKGNIKPTNGTVTVQGNNVTGTLRWCTSTQADCSNPQNCQPVPEPSCVISGRARNCKLSLDPLGRITPPDTCIVCLQDDGANSCGAYVRGCIPGARTPLRRATGTITISTGATNPVISVSGLSFRPRYVEINIGGIYQPDSISPSIPGRVNQASSYNERDTGTTACLESRIYNDVAGDDFLNWTDKAVSLQAIISGAGFSGPVNWADDGFSVSISGTANANISGTWVASE